LNLEPLTSEIWKSAKIQRNGEKGELSERRQNDGINPWITALKNNMRAGNDLSIDIKWNSYRYISRYSKNEYIDVLKLKENKNS